MLNEVYFPKIQNKVNFQFSFPVKKGRFRWFADILFITHLSATECVWTEEDSLRKQAMTSHHMVIQGQHSGHQAW